MPDAAWMKGKLTARLLTAFRDINDCEIDGAIFLKRNALELCPQAACIWRY